MQILAKIRRVPLRDNFGPRRQVVVRPTVMEKSLNPNIAKHQPFDSERSRIGRLKVAEALNRILGKPDFEWAIVLFADEIDEATSREATRCFTKLAQVIPNNLKGTRVIEWRRNRWSSSWAG